MRTSLSSKSITDLLNFVKDSRNLICITGAGISTASGIPDYRGPNGSYSKGHKPISFQSFISSDYNRKRYWARSSIGWKKVSRAIPNEAHKSLKLLEDKGFLKHIITQNVDRLHQKSGSINVIDLHGRNDVIRCNECSTSLKREDFQTNLESLNNELLSYYMNTQMFSEAEDLRPDGDANLVNFDYSQFQVPSCPRCGGLLRPDFVFFGENVPLNKVEQIYNLVEKSDGLLVVGTSLEVFSAYRFVRKASALNIPIAVINQGITRAERQNLPIVFKSDAPCEVILKKVSELL